MAIVLRVVTETADIVDYQFRAIHHSKTAGGGISEELVAEAAEDSQKNRAIVRTTPEVRVTKMDVHHLTLKRSFTGAYDKTRIPKNKTILTIEPGPTKNEIVI